MRYDGRNASTSVGKGIATCRDGQLLVQHLGELPKRDPMSDILLRVIGPDNFHPIEFQLYYANLRNNAVRRVDAYLAAHPKNPYDHHD